MSNSKSALIIATELATSGFESGASLRVASILDLIQKEGFVAKVVSRSEAKVALKSSWDLIVIVSFSAARFLQGARKKTKNLWFDPTDSWTVTRVSLFRSGDSKQILLLIRDLFWLWTSPKIDFLTFITVQDEQKEKLWWKLRVLQSVLPIHGLDRNVLTGPESRLIFIGDGGYKPNQDAKNFLRETLDWLASDTKIHLFGKGMTDADSRFVSHGYVPREQLYFSQDIHLAPVFFGGGLKLKVAIPLWNGLRVIATPVSGNGFVSGKGLTIAQDPKGYAEQICRLLKDQNSQITPKPRGEIYQCDQTTLVVEWLRVKTVKTLE
jgi:hypothetical protein